MRFLSIIRHIRRHTFQAIFLPILGFSNVGHAQSVEVVTGTDYAPYTSQDLPFGGVISEIVGLAFKEVDYSVVTNFYPWKRGYARVLSLQSDATFPYAWSDERAEDFFYSRPVNEINIRVFHNSNTVIAYENNENLNGMTYCQPLGYQTEPELSEMIERGRLFREQAKNMDTCFLMLNDNRVDFVVSNDFVAWEAARRALGDEAEEIIVAAPKAFRSLTEHLIVSKKHPSGDKIIEDFNRGYQALVNSGKLQKVWEQRMGTDVSPIM